MTGLSDAGARVLVIATATHQGPLLPSVPSVARTFSDLRAVLTGRCGVRPDALRALLDPPDARAMALAVTEAAQQADSVLLVYFVGHGLLGPGGELFLAASGTDRLTPGMAEHQALSFSSLRQALEASRAASVVVVLDCCFSGRVSLSGGASVPAFTVPPAHGLYLLGSAEQLALAPPDARHTAFSGALIELLTHGDPRGPRTLTLDAVYDAVFRELREQQRPLPRRQAGDRSGQLVIAPNPAAPEPAPHPEEPEPAPGPCPYPGLDAFEVDDAEVFRGRTEMTGRLLAAVAASASRPGQLILVGPSGSGKTSLLNAGLLARLREGALPGSAGWPCLRLTPGKRPLQRLAACLDADAPDAAGLLREDPESAVRFADRLDVERPGRRLVVLVDQLEELFTLCQDPGERTAFLRAVTALSRAADGDPPAVVMLALRADFYGRATEHPELLAALGKGQLLVTPMAPRELRAAIEEPAAHAGLTLGDGLADLILHELGATEGGQLAAGALPLLSHTLWATWRECAGSRLTVAGYRATGGISGAIATTAEQVYTGLDTAGRVAARHTLLRLVHVGEEAVDTARPVDRSALLHAVPDTRAAQQAVGRLAEARLLTLDRDTVRISHEALLHAWPRLRGWIDADRDWLRARQRLADDAAAWEQSGRDSSLLYRGTRLSTLRERAEEAATSTAELDSAPDSTPGTPLADFVNMSWRHERRGVRRRRLAVAFLALLALLASAGLLGSVVFQRQAEQAHERDLARYLAAEAEDLRDKQPGLAKQLSLLSYRMDHKAGQGALLNSQRTPGVIDAKEPAYDLANSADGRVLATSTGDSIVVRAQDDGTGRIGDVVPGPIAVSRDGKTLAAATYDTARSTSATLRLWDISDPAHPRQTAASKVKNLVTALALSPDGSTLYAGTGSEIRLWDIGDRGAPTPLPTLRGHSAQLDSLAVSPRRALLASSSRDGRVRVWNLADPAHPTRVAALKASPYERRPGALPSPLHRVAFDRTGRMVAAPVTVKNNETLGLWRLDGSRPPRRIGPPVKGSSDVPSSFCSEGVSALAFSPIRDHAVWNCNGVSQIWLYRTATAPGWIMHGAKVASDPDELTGGATTILFDPSKGRTLLEATERGIRVWHLSNAAQPGAEAFLPVTPGTGAQFDYRSAGKRQLLAIQGVGSNYLWDMTHLPVVELLARTRSPNMFTGADIALSPDGRLLADVEAHGGTKEKPKYADLRLRSTAHPRGRPLATLGELENGVAAIAFSPDGRRLAVADMNGWIDNNRKPPAVRLYDIADPRHPRQLARIKTTAVGALVFSPDGKTLIADDSPLKKPEDNRPEAGVRLRSWDLSKPAHPSPLWTHRFPSGVRSVSVAFRPDGKLFAAFDSEGTLRVWPVDRNRLSGQPSRVTIGDYGSPLAFSPDGKRLALIAKDAKEGVERPEIWDMTDPEDLTRQSYLPGASIASFYSLAFSPGDDELLAITRSSAGVDLWDTSPKRVVTELCNAVGDPITRQQWERYLPDRAYRPPCE
ncbi:caspase family protein [Streptomyces aurantiacus]|uniref:Uncharacterized protein n=1 Tax=Streptomyces aurantiacus JA 4570 TaxID=1286094 RepID=S3ZQA6_9ACTN|nr:caspase family protein [Streptomyces aurantiacus]EPH45004.1 hypothetical protein STRAU_1905 [Streptomyces aurantiacus JA 4570]